MLRPSLGKTLSFYLLEATLSFYLLEALILAVAVAVMAVVVALIRGLWHRLQLRPLIGHGLHQPGRKQGERLGRKLGGSVKERAGKGQGSEGKGAKPDSKEARKGAGHIGKSRVKKVCFNMRRIHSLKANKLT